MTCYDLSWHVK